MVEWLEDASNHQIVSGGDRILSDIEKLWIFTIVKMRFGMFEVKYHSKVDRCSLGADAVPESGATPRKHQILSNRQIDS